MTPQERQMIDQLFDRLATLENAPRDPDAVRAISEGLARAPGAIYPLVQSVLVQDEALKRADARIRELESELGVEAGQPAQQPGFLDNMRDALFGKSQGASQGSVPTVRQGQSSGSPWGPAATGAAPMQQPMPQQGYAPPGAGGGSFLGTAAASAAGVIGGALLMNSFRGMFGGHQTQAFGDYESADRGTPWGSGASGSDLARDAGVNDIGGGGNRFAAVDDNSQPAGLFDGSDNDVGNDSSDFGGDSGGTEDV